MIHVVLFEPEIPQNTGNIMRTCVATGARLHLIQPLGFKLDETKLKRSAVDYYDKIKYSLYSNWEEFTKQNQGQMFFLSRYGQKNYSNLNIDFEDDIFLIFGKESTGIPKNILVEHLEKCYRIPTTSKVRSLNLSNAVAIVLYEVLRQNEFSDLELFEPEIHKGKDYLIK